MTICQKIIFYLKSSTIINKNNLSQIFFHKILKIDMEIYKAKLNQIKIN